MDSFEQEQVFATDSRNEPSNCAAPRGRRQEHHEDGHVQKEDAKEEHEGYLLARRLDDRRVARNL